MDSENMPMSSEPSSETSADALNMPPDIELRLLEAERLLRMHRNVEDAFIEAVDMDSGCRVMMQSVCNVLNADYARMSVLDSATPDLVWPADAPAEPDTSELVSRTRAGLLAWSRLEDDGSHLLIALPIGTRFQPIASLLLSMRHSYEPSEALQRALSTLGLRVGRFVARERLMTTLRESERRWSTTVASISDAVITTDTVGRITFMNDVAITLTGWTYAEAMGQVVHEVFNIVNERTHERVGNPVTQVLETGRVTSLSNLTLLVGSDRTEVPIEGSAAPIRDEAGHMHGTVLVFRDVTQRRRSVRELQQSRDYLDVILQGIADGITAQRPDGKLVYANPAAARVLGYTRVQDLLDATSRAVLNHYDILDEEGQPLPPDLLPGRVALRTGEINTRIVRFRVHTTGEEHWAVTRAAPVFDGQGRVEMAVNVFLDITERIRAEEAQRRQAALIDLSPDGIFMRKLDGTITFWSHGAESLYGWTREEALGRLTQDLLRTRYPRPLHEIIEQLRQSEKGQWTGELHHYARDGGEIVVQSFWQAQFNEQGEVTELMESNVDVTARKRTEQTLATALRQTEELYEMGRRSSDARNAQDVLKVLLANGYLRQAHHASISVFDHPWVDISDPPETIKIAAAWNAEEDTSWLVGRSMPIEVGWLQLLQERKGEIFVDGIGANPSVLSQVPVMADRIDTYSIAVFPLIANSEMYGLLAVHFRQTHASVPEDLQHLLGLVDQAAVSIHNLQSLLAEKHARGEAERANALRLRFLAMISHDLRTPLTSIKGFATTLLAEDVRWDLAQQRDFIRTIDHEADILADMIDQILDLSSIEAGSMHIEPQPQTLDSMIAAAHAELSELTKAHTLVVSLPAGLPKVNADARRVTQVLTNLVGNAAKYSPPDTYITLEGAIDSTGYVRVSVHDEGPGIAPEDRRQVFEAYRRGNDGNVRQTKGAGLGLAICKGLVEAHGGSIWIDGQGVAGTTIAFTLPVAN